MNNKIKQKKKLHIIDLVILIGIIIFLGYFFISLVLCIVNSITNGKRIEKIEKVNAYYEEAYKLAFTDNQKKTFINIGKHIDYISNNIPCTINENEIDFTEFEELTQLYEKVKYFNEMYSNQMDTIANKVVIEGQDENSEHIKYSMSNAKQTELKLIETINIFKQEYHTILQKRNIDTAILEHFNVLSIDYLPKDIDLLVLDEFVNELGELNNINKIQKNELIRYDNEIKENNDLTPNNISSDFRKMQEESEDLLLKSMGVPRYYTVLIDRLKSYDINDIDRAKTVYELSDALLNNIYQDIKNNFDEELFYEIKEEQIKWLEAKIEIEESLKSNELTKYQKLVDLTLDRCKEFCLYYI